MIAQFSIVPIGTGVHLSVPLARAMRIIDDSGLDYRVGPMSTVVEGSWDQVLRLVRRCHEEIRSHCPRVLTTITIDDRRGATGRISGKVRSVVRRAGRSLKT